MTNDADDPEPRPWDGTDNGLLIFLRERGVSAHDITRAQNNDIYVTFEPGLGYADTCQGLLSALSGLGATHRISAGMFRAVLAENMPPPARPTWRQLGRRGA